MPRNADRALRAIETLEAYVAIKGEGSRDLDDGDVIDLLTDILHFLNDPEGLLSSEMASAQNHYEAERECPRCQDGSGDCTCGGCHGEQEDET